MNPGDIIQITNETHPWYPSLLIVSEVKAWGVVAYALIPTSNDNSKPVGLAFNRINSNDYEKVGSAVITNE